MQTLDALPLGQSCRVVDIHPQAQLARRIVGLGLLPGTKITALHKSISGAVVAYRIRGAVVALRKADAKNISVQML